MHFQLKPLKNLTDNHHKADYKSGGNYQTSYYRFLEEGGTRLPEIILSHNPLTCDYILSNTLIPFKIDVRTHNKLRGDIQVTTSLGTEEHVSHQSSNEAYEFTFYANSIDVAESKFINMVFKGLNKFDEMVEYTLQVPYEVEVDCYSLSCESNSSEVSFDMQSQVKFTLGINGTVYSDTDLKQFEKICKENNLLVEYYVKPLATQPMEFN